MAHLFSSSKPELQLGHVRRGPQHGRPRRHRPANPRWFRRAEKVDYRPSTGWTMISTLRLLARPSGEPLSATGLESPTPCARICSVGTPREIRKLTTDWARRSESAWFDAAEPCESVCPSTTILWSSCVLS